MTQERQQVLDWMRRKVEALALQGAAAEADARKTEAGDKGYGRAREKAEKLDRLYSEFAKARDLIVHHYAVQDRRRQQR